VDLTETPEPGTMLLLLAGALSGLAIRAMLAGKSLLIATSRNGPGFSIVR